jgi:hypothetical protein
MRRVLINASLGLFFVCHLMSTAGILLKRLADYKERLKCCGPFERSLRVSMRLIFAITSKVCLVPSALLGTNSANEPLYTVICEMRMYTIWA